MFSKLQIRFEEWKKHRDFNEIVLFSLSYFDIFTEQYYSVFFSFCLFFPSDFPAIKYSVGCL